MRTTLISQRPGPYSNIAYNSDSRPQPVFFELIFSWHIIIKHNDYYKISCLFSYPPESPVHPEGVNFVQNQPSQDTPEVALHPR